MQNFTLMLSALLASVIHALNPTPKTVVVVREVPKISFDPNGLMFSDLAYAERHFKPVTYNKGDTLEDIAHAQGLADALHFMKTKVIGRRTNNGTI